MKIGFAWCESRVNIGHLHQAIYQLVSSNASSTSIDFFFQRMSYLQGRGVSIPPPKGNLNVMLIFIFEHLCKTRESVSAPPFPSHLSPPQTMSQATPFVTEFKISQPTVKWQTTMSFPACLSFESFTARHQNRFILFFEICIWIRILILSANCCK